MTPPWRWLFAPWVAFSAFGVSAAGIRSENLTTAFLCSLGGILATVAAVVYARK